MQFGLLTSLYSKNLNGTLRDSGGEGKLVSNSNLHYGFNFGYSLTGSLRFLFEYQSREIDFDNTEKIIAGDKSFEVSSLKAGLRLIAHPRVAFRLMMSSEKDIAFDINDSNQAMVYAETMTYFSVFYDQIILLSPDMFSGFRLGYDIPISSDTIQDRSGNSVGIFGVIGSLEVNYTVKKITKSNSDLDFDESDSALNFIYSFVF